MKFLVGTSGYSYKEWKGAFYPEKFPDKEMLTFYSRHFSTVELNNTFRRLPSENAVRSWAEQVPSTFRFAVKAPQVITHFKRLKDVGSELDQLWDTVSQLKRRLGPILFQLPPNFKKDVPRLKSLVELLENRTSAAFEFRNASWFDDEVCACLRAHKCALCIADVDDAEAPKIVQSARWGYVRLRREKYTDRQLEQWIERLRAQKWTRVFVYFKHDDAGVGPKLAARFLTLAKT